MCGIVGILAQPGKYDIRAIKQLARMLRHRGPDAEGFMFVDEARNQCTIEGVGSGGVLALPEPVPDTLRTDVQVAVGCRRLSIIDLSPSGQQPMGQNDCFIVLNGEIYNYIELRAELQALGCSFQSRSDTEVLLAAYCQWGSDCLQRLEGMFAVAIVDLRRRKLFLARDRFGIKPLFYHQRENSFAFASEMAVLLQLPAVTRRIDPQALFDCLQHGITDHGQGTLFAEVRQVPAAHWMEVCWDEPAAARPVRYWDLALEERVDLPFHAAADQLRDLFLESVRLHLRSDVPVGVALSGGVDSSAIVMAMRRLGGPGLELHTFSYVVDDETIGEERWADLVAEAAKTRTHKLRLDPQELVADFHQLLEVQDEPFPSPTIYAQQRVFRAAREAGIKVVLEGQGADELLGGYRYFLHARLASMLRERRWREALRFMGPTRRLTGKNAQQVLRSAVAPLLPTAVKTSIRRLTGYPPTPAWVNASWFADRTVSARVSPNRSGRYMLRRALYEDLYESHLPALLHYSDHNAMASSVENRVPFLWPSVAKFVFSLPEEYVIAQNGTSKAIFRQAMRGMVPDEILNRQDKVGFGTPVLRWLHELSGWVEQRLKQAEQIPVLRADVLRSRWAKIRAGEDQAASSAHLVWRWIVLASWAERFAVKFE